MSPFSITSGVAPRKVRSNRVKVQKHLSLPITQLSYSFESPLTKGVLKRNYIFLYNKSRNTIVFGMPSGLELPKNRTLPQEHKKKYKLPNECDSTRRIKQNKESKEP